MLLLHTLRRYLFRHTQVCAPCRTDGADCPDAGRLRQAWRDAKTTVAA